VAGDVLHRQPREATSVIPEPSTYALMGTGLLGLLGIARAANRA
jgi:hypothetical protein